MVMFPLIFNRHKIAFHKYNQTKGKKGKGILKTMFMGSIYVGINRVLLLHL